MSRELYFGVMWVWTWGDPVVIIYSLNEDGRMYFHSIKKADEYSSAD